MATNKSRKTRQTTNSREVNHRADGHARYEFSNKATGRVVHAGHSNRVRTGGAKSARRSGDNLNIQSTGAAHRALVQRATRSAIELHRDALKELERY